MESLSNALTELLAAIAGPDSRLWPMALLVSLGICALVYRHQAIRIPFVQWLFPKSIYFHASHLVDIKVFFLNRIFSTLGLFGLVVFSASVSVFILQAFGSGASTVPFHPVLVALLLLVVSDFSTYWVHRIHHENRFIWPFHALHHSAEVMTPITVFRKHPVYDLISSFVRGILIGLLQGVFLCIFDQYPSFATIAGVNAFYIVFNMVGANLRHSHVWLSFGPALEHIVISPAQHQIHHSLDPRHHNKNYGEVLAIWDWMFGTLYVPQEQEQLEFGLGDSKGNRIKQPHDSLTAAMMGPMRDSLHQIRKALKRVSEHKNITDNPRTVRREDIPTPPPAFEK